MQSNRPLTLFVFTLSGALVACVGQLDSSRSTSSAVDIDPDANNPWNAAPTVARAYATAEGCADAIISGDLEAFTSIAALTVPSDDPSTTELEQVHCRITMDYEFEPGWQLVAPSVYVRGYRYLEEGDETFIQIDSSLDGVAGPTVIDRQVQPMNDDYQLNSDGNGALTPCGATSARLTVSVAATGKGSQVSFIDSIDMGTDWRPCTP